MKTTLQQKKTNKNTEKWETRVTISNKNIDVNEFELTSYPDCKKKQLSPSEMCLICTSTSAVAAG